MTVLRGALVLALLVLALLGGALSMAWGAAPPREPTAREDVALLLFGLPDPDHLEVKGLHGFGGHLVPLGLSEPARCRFRLATADRSEEIDFTLVSAIRHAVVNDPAAGLVNALGGAARRPGQDLPQVALARVIGTEDALCNGQTCVATRVFALSDPGRLEQARGAAADFRARFCPGLPGE